MLTNALILAAGLVSQVAAHGIVNKITVAGGQTYDGYIPYGSTANKVGWITPGNKDWGFVLPTEYGSPDIICHKGGLPATAAVEVPAGGELTLQWDQWAESHHGPVIDYLAPANTEDISKIDKTQLKFVKIKEGGQTGGKTSNPPALLFASDDLRSAGLTWKVKIPANIKAGYYVLRHEMIALHAADKLNEAQNYPQCITLKVTGAGTVVPTGGVPATSFYKATDPGINYNLYWDVKLPYMIPGPTLWSGTGSAASPAVPAPVVSQSAAKSPVASPKASPIVKVVASPIASALASPSPVASSHLAQAPVISPIPSPAVKVDGAVSSAVASPETGSCGRHRKHKAQRSYNKERRHVRDLAM